MIIFRSERHNITIRGKLIGHPYLYEYIFAHGRDRVNGITIECNLTEDEVNAHLDVWRINHLKLWKARGKLDIPEGFEKFYKSILNKAG